MDVSALEASRRQIEWNMSVQLIPLEKLATLSPSDNVCIHDLTECTICIKCKECN
jgi:hypothetical protein